MEFFAWYFLKGKAVAFAAMNQGPVTMIVNEAMKLNLLPSAQDIKSGKVGIQDIQKLVKNQE